MPATAVFHDRIALRLKNAGEVGDTLGPGRLQRCSDVSLSYVWEDTADTGSVVLQHSHHQNFPGVPETVQTFAPGVPGETGSYLVPRQYLGGFLRLKVAVGGDVNGGGFSCYAMGRR